MFLSCTSSAAYARLMWDEDEDEGEALPDENDVTGNLSFIAHVHKRTRRNVEKNKAEFMKRWFPREVKRKMEKMPLMFSSRSLEEKPLMFSLEENKEEPMKKRARYE